MCDKVDNLLIIVIMQLYYSIYTYSYEIMIFVFKL